MMMMKSGVDWRKKIPRRVNFADILPNEILVHIIKDCSSKDIGRVSNVLWEILVKKGEHKDYFTEDPISQSIAHIVESFRQSLLLPVNLIARLGRGKGFPYPTMFLQPCNILGISQNTRAWVILKKINKKNTIKSKVLVEKISNTIPTARIQEFYVDVKKMIPRREHEKGLEIGGIFFEVDCIKTVATEFNEMFKSYSVLVSNS